jgi:cell wall-associated NlpC family hydrolase
MVPHTTGDSYNAKAFHDDKPFLVKITISTSGCAGKTVYVTLVEASGLTAHSPTPINQLKEQAFVVPESNNFVIFMKAGENQCYNSISPHCRYHIIVGTQKPDPSFYSDDTLTLDPLVFYYSKDKPSGNLAYNCDTVPTGGLAGQILTGGLSTATNGCFANWEYLSDTSANSSNAVTAQDGGNVGDPNSACAGKGEDCYELYSGFAEVLNSRLDTLDSKFDTVKASSLGGLINGFIALAIGIGGVLAVVMIMYQGFKYLKTDNPVTIEQTKSSILKTFIGFLLLLFIYTILRTINPDLLNLTPRIDTVAFDPGGDTETASAPVNGQTQANLIQNASTYGINCPGSGGVSAIPAIAQSFVGKVTYQFGAKGYADSSNMLYFDCSGFVKAVYACAGLPALPDGTTGLFTGGTQQNNTSGGFSGTVLGGLTPPAGSVNPVSVLTPTSANGFTLQTGDLLGWKVGDLTEGKPEGHGHVVLYIGNGQTIESRSTGKIQIPGKALLLRDASAYKKRVKFIRHAP